MKTSATITEATVTAKPVKVAIETEFDEDCISPADFQMDESHTTCSKRTYHSI
jgi:hypothetical protein